MENRISFEEGTWLNPPERFSLSPEVLEFDVHEGTDFWWQTHYGFEHANGHALLFDVPQVFVAELTFSGRFDRKYEQAGILLWEDETRWIKAGVEFADGRANLAAVVTRGRSDWSMSPADPEDREWTLRMTVTEAAVIVHIRGSGDWQILRVADFVASPSARIGPMACSPLSAGLRVRFRDFRLLPMPDDQLYISG